MTKVIAICGPCHSGKSTLIKSLCARYKGDNRVLFVSDLQDVVWKSLVDTCSFRQFEEVYNDKDYLFTYVITWVKKLGTILKNNINRDNTLLVLDGGPLDIMIYTTLHLWFHYPSIEVQERVMEEILSYDRLIDKYYMVSENDKTYPVGRDTLTLRQRMTDFLKNRNLELLLYSIYRDREKVCSLYDDVNKNFEALVAVINLELEGK